MSFPRQNQNAPRYSSLDQLFYFWFAARFTGFWLLFFSKVLLGVLVELVDVEATLVTRMAQECNAYDSILFAPITRLITARL